MIGNFDSPMELRDKRQNLEVCGPLQWAAGDGPVTVQVTVRQKNEEVDGDSAPMSFSPNNAKWMFQVVAGKKLKSGLANATGRAISVASGQVVNEWEQVVELTRHDLDEDEVVEIIEAVIGERSAA